MKRTPLTNAVLWFVLIMGTAAFVFPLWWMTVVSLETPQRAEAAITGSSGIALFPPNPQFANYANAVRETGSVPWMGFGDALSTSSVVTVLVVLGIIAIIAIIGINSIINLILIIVIIVITNKHLKKPTTA